MGAEQGRVQRTPWGVPTMARGARRPPRAALRRRGEGKIKGRAMYGLSREDAQKTTALTGREVPRSGVPPMALANATVVSSTALTVANEQGGHDGRNS